MTPLVEMHALTQTLLFLIDSDTDPGLSAEQRGDIANLFRRRRLLLALHERVERFASDRLTDVELKAMQSDFHCQPMIAWLVARWRDVLALVDDLRRRRPEPAPCPS